VFRARNTHMHWSYHAKSHACGCAPELNTFERASAMDELTALKTEMARIQVPFPSTVTHLSRKAPQLQD
jgi:hypothetical protein